MTIEQKREMLWNALDSFAHSESEKIVKQEELVDYMLKNIPEKVFRKGFDIGFTSGFNIALSCLNIQYKDIKSINIPERKLEIENDNP